MKEKENWDSKLIAAYFLVKKFWIGSSVATHTLLAQVDKWESQCVYQGD